MFLSEWRKFPSAPCLAGKETWWQLASRFCWNRTRPWSASELVSFLVGLRTYQHPGKFNLSPYVEEPFVIGRRGCVLLLLLLPLALQHTVGFGLSNNVLPFFIYATNSLHLLTPNTWRSLSTSSFHLLLGLPLLLVPSRSWVKIFWGILSSSILSRWPNQLILCPFIHFTIFSLLFVSSSSRFVRLFHEGLCTERDLNGKTVSSRQRTQAVRWERAVQMKWLWYFTGKQFRYLTGSQHALYIRNKWIYKSASKKKITKTICDSVNHTRLPKDVLLPDWTHRDNKGKKGDGVE